MKDRFPLVIGVLVVVALAVAAYGLSGCGARTASSGPVTGAPVMYEFSTDT